MASLRVAAANYRLLGSALLFATAAFMVAPAQAQLRAAQEQSVHSNPRVMELAEQLRCLVCQNQTIAESNAALAVDFKNQIAQMIAAGKSDDEIMRFMVDRYGDFVLYRPPVKASTYLLWGGPMLFALLGAWVLLRRVRASSHAGLRSGEAAGNADDEARAEALLAGKEPHR
ncbi:MAG TPA: cytochrome c-type biogenesis protein [Usitatibacteraceae bacterium]|nr:cytochrome c-type biogenesis protein [Usitatibacteraceae bacterium]